MSDGMDEKLKWIEGSWSPAIMEFLQLFIDLDREPTDVQLEALGSVLGRSHNEGRTLLARQAKAQGSSLLSKWA